MTDETEQEILDAALKVFSQKGYKGATTRVIAKESGFSELTLFRKFKTKENLFNSVLIKNRESILKELDSTLIKSEFENPKDFLKFLIESLANLTENNFEFVSIIVHNRRKISGNILMEIMVLIYQYIEKVFPGIQIDPKIFVLNIFSFIYFLIFDKHRRSFFNYEEAIEEFIDYSTRCLQL